MFDPQITPIQPINVIVHNPPSWPLWATTLFSAMVGGIFGTAANLVTDELKRFRRVRRLRGLLSGELMRNQEQAEAGVRILKDAEGGSATDQARAVGFVAGNVVRFNSERFDRASQADAELLWDIDKGKQLEKFYDLAKDLKSTGQENVPFADRDFLYTLSTIESMEYWAKEFIEKNKLKYKPEPSVVENMYLAGKRLLEKNRP
jgi:hypothetical protein